MKKYQAKDMQEAMDTVIKELGSDAVILNSRKVRKKGLQYLFRKPMQEVMVAYDPAKMPMAKKLGNNPYVTYGPPKPDNSAKKAADISKEQLVALDNRIDSLDRMLNDFISKFTYVKREITYDYSKTVEELVVKMIENEVLDELAHLLAKETEQLIRNREGTSALEAMEHLLLEKLGIPDPITPKKFSQKVILVIGPTGVGKTTTIVKLAANFSVKQKKKVGIINTDTYRIAAQEQLRTYADILGIPLSIVYQTNDIEKEVEAMSDRELIFIDTAGKRPGDEQHKEDITNIIQKAKPEDILLCVSATTSFQAIKDITDTYGFVGNYKLLITKLDETKHRGMLLNLSWYTKKRLAYVTTGQNVPDDIENIDTLAIAGHILRQ